MGDTQKCTHEMQSASVSVILLFAPALRTPYPLIPEEGYTCCVMEEECFWRELFLLVTHAQNLHPMTKDAGSWTKAIILFSDGEGKTIKAKRPPAAQA